ncbi:MAG: YcgN family cysteine cluster protein [Sneathiellaceae bacterium]
MAAAEPFWRSKTLVQMDADEWESLCDGCGKCCLHKIEWADTREIEYTNVACRLFDSATCRCTDYADRKAQVPDCVMLTPQVIDSLNWMPVTCAYRLVAEGRDLPPWHHLVCGDRNEVHRVGVGMRGLTLSEDEAGDLEDHIVDWIE